MTYHNSMTKQAKEHAASGQKKLRKQRQGPKGTQVQIRMSEDVRQGVEQQAEKYGLSLSEYIRFLVVADLKGFTPTFNEFKHAD